MALVMRSRRWQESEGEHIYQQNNILKKKGGTLLPLERELLPFLPPVMRIAVNIAASLRQVYRQEQAITPHIRGILDQSRALLPAARNYIFREILYECSKADDLSSFKTITTDYGNRFGLLRHIPVSLILEDEISHGLEILEENFQKELFLKKTDMFVTRDLRYLNLMEPEEEEEPLEEGVDKRILSLCPFRLANMEKRRLALVITRKAAGHMALLEGDAALAAWFLKRGALSDEYSLVAVMGLSDVCELGLLEAAIQSGRPDAVRLALSVCSPDRMFRSCRYVDSTGFYRVGETQWKSILSALPEAAEHVCAMQAVRSLSTSLLSGWLRGPAGSEAGSDERYDEEKVRQLRQVLAYCIDISEPSFIERRHPLSWEIEEMCRADHWELQEEGEEWKEVISDRGAQEEQDGYEHAASLLRPVFKGEDPAPFFRKLQSIFQDREGKCLAAKLAFLYRMAGRPAISQDDMIALFAPVTDVTWYYCLIWRKCFNLNTAQGHFLAIRRWMGKARNEKLQVGEDFEGCEGYTIKKICADGFRERHYPVFVFASKMLGDFIYRGPSEFISDTAGLIEASGLWSCCVDAYRNGFLDRADLLGFLGMKHRIPDEEKERIMDEAMKEITSVCIRKQLQL